MAAAMLWCKDHQNPVLTLWQMRHFSPQGYTPSHVTQMGDMRFDLCAFMRGVAEGVAREG
jgi:hypothetical protein